MNLDICYSTNVLFIRTLVLFLPNIRNKTPDNPIYVTSVSIQKGPKYIGVRIMHVNNHPINVFY